MQYKLQKYSLRNIYRGGLFLLLFISISLRANEPLKLDYVNPSDLIINLNPNIISGKASIFWTAPDKGSYTLKYKVDSEEKIAFENISCEAGEIVKFFITSNSITTETRNSCILDFLDGVYPFYLTFSTESNKTYSTNFTITVDGTPPAPPDNFKGIPADGAVKLEWEVSPISTDIESYIVYFSPTSDVVSLIQNGGEFETINIPGSQHEYYLTGLENNTTYHFVIRAKDFADNYSEFSKEITVTPRRTYTLADLTDEEGGCFIATASYGNINNPMVIIFRMFRDRILRTTPEGRKIIEFYYKTSPPYANFISHHPIIRSISLLFLTFLAMLIFPIVLFTINPPVVLLSSLILTSIMFNGKGKGE